MMIMIINWQSEMLLMMIVIIINIRILFVCFFLHFLTSFKWWWWWIMIMFSTRNMIRIWKIPNYRSNGVFFRICNWLLYSNMVVFFIFLFFWFDLWSFFIFDWLNFKFFFFDFKISNLQQQHTGRKIYSIFFTSTGFKMDVKWNRLNWLCFFFEWIGLTRKN